MTNKHPVTLETARRALTYIAADERATWVKMGAALKSEYGEAGFDLFDQWSETAANYDAKAVKATWRGFNASGKVTIGSLIYEAKKGGFDPKKEASNAPAGEQTAEARQKRADERAAKEAAEALEVERRHNEASKVCTADFNRARTEGLSRYLGIKGVAAHGLRFEAEMPTDDGAVLLMPLRDNAGKIWNVQRIAADGRKVFHKGARVSGLYHLLGEFNGVGWLLVAEGYATAATLYEATGYPVAVGLNASVLKAACVSLRERYPEALILICADNDQSTAQRTGKNSGVLAAQEAAMAVGACVAIPQGLPHDKNDFNDLFNTPVHAGGGDEVKRQIEAAMLNKNANHSDDKPQPLPSQPATPTLASNDTHRSESGRFVGGYAHFTCDENGVVYHFTKDNKPQQTFICAPLYVTANTRNESDDDWGYLLEFKDPLGNNKRWCMPASMLNADGASYRAQLLSMGLRIESNGNARTLLTRYIQNSKVDAWARCSNKMGWFEDAFVLPDVSLGDSDGERVIFQTGIVSSSPFKRNGMLNEWQANIAAPSVGNSRLMFALSCAFAGVLLEPSGVQSGGFHIVGDSSVGKSTALNVAASVYGARKKFVKTWRATDASLESTAEQHSDTLLILDEIAQVDAKIVGDVVYMLGNEQGKGRNKNTGGARGLADWRVLYLSSGEVSLNDHMKTAGKVSRAGQETRLVNLQADAGCGYGLFDTLNGFADGEALAKHFDYATRHYYGVAGFAFIEYAVKHITKLRKRLHSEVANLAHEWTPAGAHGQVSRVAQRFAIVAIAGEMATEAGITGWTEGAALQGVKQCFDSWLAEREGGAGNSEILKMREQAMAFFAAHSSRFVWWHRASDSHAPSVSNRAGFKRLFEGDKPLSPSKADFIGDPNPETAFDASDCVEVYYVMPNTFKSEICNGFDSRAMSRLLVADGILKSGADGAALSVKLPGMGKQRCYVFIQNTLNAP